MFGRNFEFEWDPSKASTNLRLHGIRFEEAADCFDDPYAAIFPDEWHSDDEPREILIGYSNKNRLLFVSFTQRAPRRIRLIGARRADAQERQWYDRGELE